MLEISDNIKTALDSCGRLLETILNAFSLFCIVAGLFLTIIKIITEGNRNPGDHPMHTYFRKMFGGWLIVALEFQLAADITGTIVSPTTSHLIELGAIALIRTFLNYFLVKELREEKITTSTGKRKNKETGSEMLTVS